MPREAEITPPEWWLLARRDEGLGQREMAAAWFEETGERPTRSAIAYSLAKYGIRTLGALTRHDDVLPWTVRLEHDQEPPAKRLRDEGRLRNGLEVPPGRLRTLENYKQNKLQRPDAVVGYYPDNTYKPGQGFFEVKRDPIIDFDIIDEASLPDAVRHARRRDWLRTGRQRGVDIDDMSELEVWAMGLHMTADERIAEIRSMRKRRRRRTTVGVTSEGNRLRNLART